MVRDIIREELEDLKKVHKSERKTKIVAAEGEFQMGRPDRRRTGRDYHFQTTIISSGCRSIRSANSAAGGAGVIGMENEKGSRYSEEYLCGFNSRLPLIFTNHGRCYWTKVWQIPEAGRRTKGRPLINLLEDLRENEKVAAILQSAQLRRGGLLAARIVEFDKLGLLTDAFQRSEQNGGLLFEVAHFENCGYFFVFAQTSRRLMSGRPFVRRPASGICQTFVQ